MLMLAAAAALLSLERRFYILISHRPNAIRAPAFTRAATDPIALVRALFFAFKIIQLGVFAAWCVAFGDSPWWIPTAAPAECATAAVLIIFGQALNASVFVRLGPKGVFYACELGHDVPYVEGFPFSWFRHPQYVGTVLSIWGVFLAMRFPNPDWLVLPMLETTYYVIGARLERPGHAAHALVPSLGSAMEEP
jgi:isoprenylcysteine carboxyl methyltransferase (ICMT) family protein YpbQ